MAFWSNALKDDVRSLEKRMEGLERSLESLSTVPKLLRTEWEDTLDRLNRVMGRLNARLKRAEKDEPEEEKGTVTPPQRIGTHEILERHRSRRRGLLPR